MQPVSDILRHTSHRPYPLPSGPWVLRQTWRHLLFAHWPVSPQQLYSVIPDGLQLDTFDGQAYIGILPFQMADVRARGLPPIPGTTTMTQINVRTYVSRDGKPGVYFLALDTNHLPTVWLTRIGLSLPYHYARMQLQVAKTANRRETMCSSERRDAPDAALQVTYIPASDEWQATPGSLEHWLTERYCLYNVHRNKLIRVDIHHQPWKLQFAKAIFHRHSLLCGTPSHHVKLPDPPLLHYSEQMDALLWLPREVS